MAIDFGVEPEFQSQIDWLKKFVDEEIEPLDQFITVRRDKQGNPLFAFLVMLMDFEVGVYKAAQEIGPYGSLMIGTVSIPLRPGVCPGKGGIVRI